MDDDIVRNSEDSTPDPPSEERRELSGPTRYCSKCATSVVPNAKGQCPTCGVFTQGNAAARKHIANIARRDQLHAENIAEYQPDTLHLRRACRWLANITERLENIKDGTPEHQRLVAMWTELTATLEASRQARAAHTTILEQLDPGAIVAKAERVLAMARLIRDSGREPAPAPGPGSEAPGLESEALGGPRNEADAGGGLSSLPESGPVLEAGADSEPLEPCPYCHQTGAHCSEIKATRLDAWRALHHNDPIEVERREKLATDEMFESLRRHGRY